MSKYNIKRIAAKFVAATMAVCITATALPIESMAAEIGQANNDEYSFDDYSIYRFYFCSS